MIEKRNEYPLEFMGLDEQDSDEKLGALEFEQEKAEINLGDAEEIKHPSLSRVYFGAGDTPGMWQFAGLRLPDANIITGAESGTGNLKPVLENGVTVVAQKDNKKYLVLRGAVEDEDHLSLSSVAQEAASKRSIIPSAPDVRGVSSNDEVAKRAQEDWRSAFDHLAHTSPTAKRALENSGAWLIADSKESLQGFEFAENEKDKEFLEGELIALDERFGDEVKHLRERYTEKWSGVGKVENGPPQKQGIMSRVFAGVGLAAALPFNPMLHQGNPPAIEQPADAAVQADLIKELDEYFNSQSNISGESSNRKSLSTKAVGVALDLYEDYVDNMVPDTPPEQIEKAKEVLEITGNVKGTHSIGKYEYDSVKARGGSDEEAIFALKAAMLGYYQSGDGQTWFHIYGKGEAHAEEVTREQVEKNTTVKAIAAAFAKAWDDGSWGGNESVGGTPVSTPEGTVQNTPEPQNPPSQSTSVLPEMTPTASSEGTNGVANILSQDEVLSIPVSDSATVQQVYDAFQQDQNVKNLFTDPADIKYSAMGIQIQTANGKDVKYPFFNVSSDKDNKGFTAMVFEDRVSGTSAIVSYELLNKVVDENGIVGFGITNDLSGNPLAKPVMVFSLGLTESQLSQMSQEELLQRDLLFIPGGKQIPQNELPRGLHVDVVYNKPDLMTQTREALQSEGITVDDGGKLIYNGVEIPGASLDASGLHIQVGDKVVDIQPADVLKRFSVKEGSAVIYDKSTDLYNDPDVNNWPKVDYVFSPGSITERWKGWIPRDKAISPTVYYPRTIENYNDTITPVDVGSTWDEYHDFVQVEKAFLHPFPADAVLPAPVNKDYDGGADTSTPPLPAIPDMTKYGIRNGINFWVLKANHDEKRESDTGGITEEILNPTNRFDIQTLHFVSGDTSKIRISDYFKDDARYGPIFPGYIMPGYYIGGPIWRSAPRFVNLRMYYAKFGYAEDENAYTMTSKIGGMTLQWMDTLVVPEELQKIWLTGEAWILR